MRHQRQLEIVRRLRVNGAISVEELASSLGVSAATVRRDLKRLQSEGKLTRVHGGAHLPSFVTEDADVDRPFALVATVDEADKRAVARAAAAMVRDGDMVLLDIGTTTQLLAQELRGRRVTIVTASLAVLDVLRDDNAVELVLLGGLVRRAYHSLVGVITEDTLRQLHADIAFMGASGVRSDGSVLDTTLVEVPVKRGLIAASSRTVLLTDRHKFPGTGTLRVCGVGDLDAIVTNAGADTDMFELCTRSGVEVVVA
ncbi:ArsR family transcriptional regulator [Micromonospora globispora]|uniref:Lactose phosphotransferase system repressor n=1 Tax=Micromonospora globispora TaxID=1450148 RepID=A0A317K414_9ACTN|nr:DeoR/GlpR family DNA-binding transcription regulator [Micromonospora globispora]PWU45893.1 ArsR family transcriptional regulator [Micromonospora globispora]PWU59220.1 ArsR family transcriptional regulator [Micromonospora globispora]RQX05959.1 ArsR family transcriptional regulator [Micromonospora globispora]